MSASPQKRSLESEAHTSGEPAAKRRETATSHKAYTALLDALQGEDCEDLPKPIATLLTGLVESCLRRPQPQRQGYHDEVAGLLREALGCVDTSLCRIVDAADNDVEDRETEKVNREAVEARAQAKCNTLRVALREKKKRVAADVAALKEASEGFNEAVSAQEAGDTKFAEAKQQIERLQEAETKILAPLKAGEFTGAKVKKQAQNLASLGRRFEFDESLTSGLVEVLVKKPDARSNFDTMVIDAFETQLKTRIAEYEKALADETPGQESREKAVAEAKAKQEEVEKQQEAGQAEAKESQALVREAQASLGQASKAVKAVQTGLRRALSAREEACAKLKYFRDGPLATFDALRAASDDSQISAALQRFEEFSASPPKQPEEAQPETGAPDGNVPDAKDDQKGDADAAGPAQDEANTENSSAAAAS